MGGRRLPRVFPSCHEPTLHLPTGLEPHRTRSRRQKQLAAAVRYSHSSGITSTTSTKGEGPGSGLAQDGGAKARSSQGQVHVQGRNCSDSAATHGTHDLLPMAGLSHGSRSAQGSSRAGKTPGARSSSNYQGYEELAQVISQSAVRLDSLASALVLSQGRGSSKGPPSQQRSSKGSSGSSQAASSTAGTTCTAGTAASPTERLQALKEAVDEISAGIGTPLEASAAGAGDHLIIQEVIGKVWHGHVGACMCGRRVAGCVHVHGWGGGRGGRGAGHGWGAVQVGCTPGWVVAWCASGAAPHTAKMQSLLTPFRGPGAQSTGAYGEAW